MQTAIPLVRHPSALRPLLPHLIWEAVLLVAVVVMFMTVLTSSSPSGNPQHSIIGQAAIIGLLATGFALSLRTATPNLAITPLASVAGWWFAGYVSDGLSSFTAAVLAVLAVAGMGVVLALIVGFTMLPAWAVTLAGAAIPGGLLATGGQTRLLLPGGDPAGHGTTFTICFAVFVLLSIAGGAFFAVPAVRAWLAANRPDAGGAASRPAKLVGALVGIVGSSAAAGLSGVLSTSWLQMAQPLVSTSTMAEVLAAVLLGGVSVYGLRAGVFGTVLGTLLVVLVMVRLELAEASGGTRLIVLGMAGLVGIGVVYLVELSGRRLDRGGINGSGLPPYVGATPHPG